MISNSLKNSYFLKTKKLIAKAANNEPNLSDENKLYLCTIIQNFRSLGFVPSKKLTEELQKMTKDELVDFYQENFPIIQKSIDADKDMNPIYKNFPQEVMDMSDFELYSNSILYYALTIGMGVSNDRAAEYINRQDEIARFPFTENANPVIIECAKIEDLVKDVKQTIESKTTISPDDKKYVKLFMSELTNIFKKDKIATFFDNITYQNKENQCLTNALIINNPNIDARQAANILQATTKTATDVLRLATYLSPQIKNGEEYRNTDLSKPTKYKWFNSKESQVLMSLLNNASNIDEDMYKYKEQWKHVAKALNTSRNSLQKYSVAQNAIQNVRNNNKPITWHTKIEAAIQEKDFEKIKYQISKRPGEFVRRLEKIASIAQEQGKNQEFLQLAKDLLPKVDSIPVIMQEINNIQKEVYTGTYTKFHNKDGVSSYYISDKVTPGQQLSEPFKKAIYNTLYNACIEKFTNKEPLGKIYIDPVAHNCNMQLNSAGDKNSMFIPLESGSRLPKTEGKDCLRFSTWWENGIADGQEVRTDIDLHAVFYNKNYENIGSISFYNLKDDFFKGYHSGDCTDAPIGKGATEFIDIRNINKDRLLEKGIKYIGLENMVFSGPSFSNMPCHVAWQERETSKAQEGDIYEAQAVKNIINISSPGRQNLGILYDVEKEEVVIADISLDLKCRTPEGMTLTGPKLIEAFLEQPRITIADIMQMQVQAGRAELVSEIDKADVIVGINNPEELREGQVFINVSNATELTSEYLDDKYREENLLNKTIETKVSLFLNNSKAKEVYLNDEQSVSDIQEYITNFIVERHADLLSSTDEITKENCIDFITKHNINICDEQTNKTTDLPTQNKADRMSQIAEFIR